MAKELKFLYESSVDKSVESKETEQRQEGGQTIEVTKTVKKVAPIKIAILKPQRRIYEEAEIYYAKQIAIFIKGGLLPYSLVAKRYANDGGALSEPEKLRLALLETEVQTLEGEFFALIGDKEDQSKARNELLVKINNKNSEINNIKNAYSDIFENTAEMKAKNKTMEWWTLHLSYIDEDGKGYVPIFGEGELDSKLNKYDEIDESENPFLNEAIRKLSYLISFWLAARATSTKIDFKSMDNLYTDTLTEYKVVEDKDPSLKVEDKTPEKDKVANSEPETPILTPAQIAAVTSTPPEKLITDLGPAIEAGT